MAKALALLCIVTNCGEGMDFRAVGTILSGLTQCGSWGCFDEFNRIDISVLSVISTQLQTIRSALLMQLDRFYVSIDQFVTQSQTVNLNYSLKEPIFQLIEKLEYL